MLVEKTYASFSTREPLSSLVSEIRLGVPKVNLLEEHGWYFIPAPFRRSGVVHNSHLHVIHNLHRGNWHASPHDFRGGFSGVSNRREGHYSNARFLRQDCELEGDLGDDTKGAFRAHEEIVEIVPCRRFSRVVVSTHLYKREASLVSLPRPTPRFDDGAVC